MCVPKVWFISHYCFKMGLKMFAAVQSIFLIRLSQEYDFSSVLKVKQCNSFSSIYQTLFHLLPHRCNKSLMYVCWLLSVSPCRSWRLVSSHLRQVPMVGGQPGRTDQDHCRRYSGPLRQLWLADVIPADVQRHGTQLETVQTGGQYRGESIHTTLM